MVLRILKNIRETVKIEPKPLGSEEVEEGYVEISAEEVEEVEPKLYVRIYFPRDFAEIRYILDDLREGYNICFVNISHLRNKNKEALKHALEKIKRTVQAINGDIVMVEDDWLIATPSIVKIYRGKEEK